MDDVQAAFQDSTSATDFETRVNEIYEGDGVILVRVAQETDRMVLEGWEDLDGNAEVDDVVDDLMFSIVRQDGQHEMVGHHANSYYRSSFGGGDFLFFYLLAGGLRGNNYYYQTPSHRGPVLRQQRDTYRGSSRYRAQQGSNRVTQHVSSPIRVLVTRRLVAIWGIAVPPIRRCERPPAPSGAALLSPAGAAVPSSGELVRAPGLRSPRVAAVCGAVDSVVEVALRR